MQMQHPRNNNAHRFRLRDTMRYSSLFHSPAHPCGGHCVSARSLYARARTSAAVQEGHKESYAFEIKVAAALPRPAQDGSGGAAPPDERSYFARVDSVPPPPDTSLSRAQSPSSPLPTSFPASPPSLYFPTSTHLSLPRSLALSIAYQHIWNRASDSFARALDQNQDDQQKPA